MEDQGEEASGTSVEPQPESHVEAMSTRGKGKGKGRGKKSQPASNESMVWKISLSIHEDTMKRELTIIMEHQKIYMCGVLWCTVC